MRVAITNPTDWQHLRRGVERFIDELGFYLGKHGHEVTVITGKPGKTEVLVNRGYRTIYCRRWWNPILGKIGFLEFHAFFFPALYRLLRERYDVVLSCTFMDGIAAQLARRFTGTPYVYTSFALPPRVQHFRSLTMKGAIHRRAAAGANRFVGISQYVAEYFRRRWSLRAQVQLLPVDMARFHLPPAGRSSRPTIFCPSALDDPRKGARVLMRAFDRLKLIEPDAILQIAWTLNPELEHELIHLVSPQFRKDVQFLGTNIDLPATFAQASVTVLASLWEALGLVMLESLAAGTPVVGTRDGALPEIITDPRIGRLFDPGSGLIYEPTNVDGLVQAIVEALALSRLPETAMNCRRHAERFSWENLGPEWEQLLLEVAGQTTADVSAVECTK